MSELAGGIEIELSRGCEGYAVSIRSSRPVSASRVFAGKGVAETVAGLPALYSVCATAQSFACVGACEAALGLAPPAGVLAARRRLVAAETVKEHLWRMLLDWPRFLGESPAEPAMGQVLAAFRRLRGVCGSEADPLRLGLERDRSDRAALAEGQNGLGEVAAAQVFGMPIARWLAASQDADALDAWAMGTPTLAARLVREVSRQGWAGLGRSVVGALPALSAAQIEERLGGESAAAFVAAPTWNGAPAETSPFSRRRSHPLVAGLATCFGNGLLPRLAAQLLELAVLLDAMAEGGDVSPETPVAASPRLGVGIAQAPAARGLLVHRVEVVGDLVGDYRILAPTEWNFHPKGAVAAGLASLPTADEAVVCRLAGLFVTAVDPCVEYDLIIR